MRRYAAEVFENNNILYHLKLDEQVGTAKLNMGKRRDIFLIYKEILNNINKHAEATEVNIEMCFKEKKLMMTICDNGKGFDKSKQTHRNGLKNLARRIACWKGSLIIDADDKGTRIKILI
jgi:signal transduction histidine kinase